MNNYCSNAITILLLSQESGEFRNAIQGIENQLPASLGKIFGVPVENIWIRWEEKADLSHFTDKDHLLAIVNVGNSQLKNKDLADTAATICDAIYEIALANFGGGLIFGVELGSKLVSAGGETRRSAV